jgi:hypothetical protein
MDLTLWEDTTCTILFDSLLNVVEKTSGLDGNLHPRSSRVENTCICTNQLVKLTISNYMAHYCTIRLRGFPSFLIWRRNFSAAKLIINSPELLITHRMWARKLHQNCSLRSSRADLLVARLSLRDEWSPRRYHAQTYLEQISPVVY